MQLPNLPLSSLALCLVPLLVAACAEQQEVKEASTTVEPDLTLIRASGPQWAEKASHKMVDSIALEGSALEVGGLKVDSTGVTHARMAMTYQGIAVRGADRIAHIANDGLLIGVTVSDTAADAALDGVVTEPSLSSQQALLTVLSDLAPDIPVRTNTELVLRPLVHEVRSEAPLNRDLNAVDIKTVVDGYELVYSVVAPIVIDGAMHRFEYEVDALSGKILGRSDVLQILGKKRPGLGGLFGDLFGGNNGGNRPTPPAIANGHTQYSGDVSITASHGTLANEEGFFLEDPARGQGNPLLAPLAPALGNTVIDLRGSYFTDFELQPETSNPYFSTVNNWGRRDYNYTQADYALHDTSTSAEGKTVAADAYYGMTVTWDFLANVLRHDGLDGNGMSFVTFVHAFYPQSTVFWDVDYNAVVIPDPVTTGEYVKQPASPEVIGHEIAHGIMQSAVGPSLASHSNEHLGIREAYSDIIGDMVETYEKHYPYQIPFPLVTSKSDWILGEEITRDGEPFRYFNRPSLNNRGYDEWFEGINATGLSVHDVAGPIDRMFYFLSQGAKPVALDFNHGSERMPEGFKGIGKTAAVRIIHDALYNGFTSGSGFLAFRNACVESASANFGEWSEQHLTVMRAFAAVNIGLPPETNPPVIERVVWLRRKGSILAITDELLLTPEVTDDSGVRKVMIYIDGASMGAPLRIEPYTLNIDPATISSGPHSLRVVAVDVWGNEAVWNEDFEHNDGIPPTICCIQSVPDVGHEREWSVIAQDDRGLQYVELFFDEVSVGRVFEAPYSWPIDTSAMATAYHTLRFMAHDLLGNETMFMRSHYVDNTPPVIISYGVSGHPKHSPHWGISVADEIGTSTPWATIGDDIKSVSLYLGSHLVGVDYTWDYGYDFFWQTAYWDSRTVGEYPTGMHEVRVVAEDLWGNISELMFSHFIDSTPPVVESLGVVGQSGTIELWANVTDNDRVKYVEFNIDENPSLWQRIDSPPYRISLDSNVLSNGQHLFRVAAYDGFDNPTPRDGAERRTFTVSNESTLPPPRAHVYEAEPNGTCAGAQQLPSNIGTITGGTNFSGDVTDNFALSLAANESVQVTVSEPGGLSCYQLAAYVDRGNEVFDPAGEGTPSMWISNDAEPRAYCVRVWLPTSPCGDYELSFNFF